MDLKHVRQILMTETGKIGRRAYIRAAGAGVLGLAVGAVAGYYGGLSTVPPSTGTPSTVTVTQSQAGQTSAVTNPLKIATIGDGPPGTTWARAILSGEALANQLIAETLPDMKLEWRHSWNVKPTDVTTVFEGYIADGVGLFISLLYSQPIVKGIIEANPSVYFTEPQFTLAETPNASTYEWSLHLGALLSGVVAGGLTKTNKIGLVAAVLGGEEARAFNCYKQGANVINPNVQAYYASTGEYHDVSLGMKAGTALISTGCDFLIGLGNGMTDGVIKAAEAAKVYAMGIYADEQSVAPSAVVSSTLWKSGKMMADLITMASTGVWPRTYSQFLPHPRFQYELKDQSVALAPFNPAIPVPDIVPKTIQQLIDDNRAGKFDPSHDMTWPPALEIR
jgi:basic membrane lipoprotein Med (substrate-binding protein (PBP1-ABC) superfamily)